MNYKVYNQFWNSSGIVNMNVDMEVLAKYCKPQDVFRCEKGIKQIQNLHRIDAPYFEEEELDECSINGEWEEWLSEKLDYAEIDIMNMQYFIKHPDYKITSPHQDGAYFGKPDELIYTAWVPLQDVSPENSCLWYVSDNLSEILPHENVGTKVRTRTGATGYSQYTKSYDIDKFQPVSLKLGDMIIHDQFALHYANENSTEIPRVALTFIFKTNKKLF